MGADQATTGNARQVDVQGMILNNGLLAGIAFGLAALFGRPTPWTLLQKGAPWPVQAALGAVIGLFMGASVVVVVYGVPAFRREISRLLGRADLRGLNPLWFSLCAGVGEEALFRGALQPLLGLGVSSLVFTAAHFQTGGFRSMNPMKAVYAMLVFLASLALGTIYARLGLLAAVVTHAVVDIVCLTALRNR